MVLPTVSMRRKMPASMAAIASAARNKRGSSSSSYCTVSFLKTRWGAPCDGGHRVYRYDDRVISDDGTTITCQYSGSRDHKLDCGIVPGAHILSHTDRNAPMKYVGVVTHVDRIREWTSRDSVAIYVLKVHKVQEPVRQFPVPCIQAGRGRTRWWTDAFVRYFGIDVQFVRTNLPYGIVRVCCGNVVDSTRRGRAKICGQNGFWAPLVCEP